MNKSYKIFEASPVQEDKITNVRKPMVPEYFL
jgi:hypothetical protein